MNFTQIKKGLLGAIVAASVPALSISIASADGHVYGPFPITLKGYSGDKTNSVSYTGQMARHVLHDSLKKLAGTGTGEDNPALEAEMMA